MEYKAEKLILIAGTSGMYQFRLSLFLYYTSLLIVTMVISFPYFEISPMVDYQSLHGKIYTNQKLTYEICENSKSIILLSNASWSWTTILQIECSKFFVALLNSSIFLGMLIGSLALKYLCNSVGRKTTFLIFTLTLNVARLCYNIPLYYTSLLIINIIVAIAEVGGEYCSILLCMECTDYATRSFMKCFQAICFCLCSIFTLIYLKFTKDWLSYLNIISGLNVILLIVAYFFIVESPLFYLHNGKLELFFKTLEIISKVNKTHIAFNTLVLQNYELVKSIDSDELIDTGNDKTKLLPDPDFYIEKKKDCYEIIKELHFESKKYKGEDSNWVFGVLFTDRKVCLNFIMLTYLSAYKSALYDGVIIMIKSLYGDIYLSGIMFNIAETFLIVIVYYMMNSKTFGRIRTLFLLILVSAIVICVAMFLDSKSFAYTVLIYSVKLLSGAMISVLAVYTIEVYPTNARAAGLSLNLAIAKIEIIFLPFLVEYMGSNTIYVFFGMSLIALVPYFFLPETYEVPISN